jgi:hypothetical protein
MAYTFTGDPNIGPVYVDIAVVIPYRDGGEIAPGPEGAITYQPQFHAGIPIAAGGVWLAAQSAPATPPARR